MEESEKINSKKIIINYGLILGIVSVLLGVISYVMGNLYQPHWSMQVLGFLILIAVIVYGINEFKKTNGGFLKLSQALKIGVGIAVVSAVISILYFIIQVNFIEPNYFENYIDFQREAAFQANPSVTQEQVDAGLEFSKPFMNTGFFVVIQFAMALFFGLIISLIAGLVMKKQNPYQA